MKEHKRTAYQTLLHQVEEGMRSVIVTASDYNELKLIHAARRLYQRSPVGLSTSVRQELSHRFASGYKVLKEKYGGSLPADWLELQGRVERYQATLEHWGLKDYQISGLTVAAYSKVVVTFLYGLCVFLLASLPSLVLNAPVGLAAKVWAEHQAKADLKRSRVKVQARDVVLSKKITFCLVAVPLLWVLYAVLLLYFTSLERRVVWALFLSCPVFSYIGVTAVEAGMVSLNDIWPAGLRLLPAFRKEAERLPAVRAELVRDVRAMVKRYAADLGPLYTEGLQEVDAKRGKSKDS